MLDSTVEVIQYSEDGVSITLNDGSVLTADYALVTFSLGVLQNDDLVFQPELPAWKTEAIHGMTMVSGPKTCTTSPPDYLYAFPRERTRRFSSSSQRSFGLTLR